MKPTKLMENYLLKNIKNVLNLHGFQIKFIPRTDKRTPDFEIIGKSDRYTVELKTKSNAELYEAKLKKGDVATVKVKSGSDNTISGIIKDANEQILSRDPSGKTYRLVWLHCTGMDPDWQFDQFMDTLFGRQRLGIPGNVPYSCYYFGESSFFTLRKSLDGAFLTFIEDNKIGLRVVVNTLSLRVESFRRSELIHSFTGSQVVFDIDDLCKTEKLMLIANSNCHIDRKKQDEVLQYLQIKYDLKNLMVVGVHKSSHAILWPK